MRSTTAAPRWRRARSAATCSGPLSTGYKQLAARFDEPISGGQPPELVSDAEAFVLRHYCCPECATLFEVDMVARTAPEVASFAIDGSVTR